MERLQQEVIKSPEQIRNEMIKKISEQIYKITEIDTEMTEFISCFLDQNDSESARHPQFYKYKNHSTIESDNPNDLSEAYVKIKAGLEEFDRKKQLIVEHFIETIDQWKKLDPDNSPKILDTEEILEIIKWTAIATKAWVEAQPDIVLVCETSALNPAFAVKECMKNLNITLPAFRRINAPYVANAMYGMDKAGRPGNKILYDGKTGEVAIEEVDLKYIREFDRDRLDILKDSIEDSTKVLIYDESANSSNYQDFDKNKNKYSHWQEIETKIYSSGKTDPASIYVSTDISGDRVATEIVKDGRLNLNVKNLSGGESSEIDSEKVFNMETFGGTVGRAVNYLLYLGTKNISIFKGEASTGFCKRWKPISIKSSIGPVHDETRQKAEFVLHDFEFCGRIASCLLKEHGDEF